MPIDAVQLRAHVADFAAQYERARHQHADRLERLRRPLRPGLLDADRWLAACLAAARMEGLRWSGALFTQGECAHERYAFGDEPTRYVLIAVDGSQILPDRHKPVAFGYVQAGCAGVVYGEAQHPLTSQLRRIKLARLIGEDELLDERSNELKPAAEIANRRDVMEVELMAQVCRLARDAGLQPMVIADGSIVPFALLNSRNLSRDMDTMLLPLHRALDEMRRCDALVCGYIDRPNSNAIAQACALADLADDGVTEQAVRRCLNDVAGIFDRHVLEGELPPGRRTALFDPCWEVNKPEYLGDHAMRACYANFGSDRLGPAIARVEVPQWCADAKSVGQLCAALQRQVGLGGGYPLILKAAHEETVVSRDDQQQIEQAIAQALIERGIVPRASFKQAAKDAD